ncbi:hypothetical protein [Streptosporangium subroseum]|uniref:hypothetical protein n=1 Tax=Streptosporangium subroseum TaxID=106412 RepID=UPI00308890CB|nr:hypothetical protein OHB15_18620 [Streptosporangium subroseum]
MVAEVVAIEARLAAVELNELGFERQPAQPAPVEESMPKVVSLTQRRLADPAAVIASLPQDTRPLPSVAGYDELLPKRAAKTAAALPSGVAEDRDAVVVVRPRPYTDEHMAGPLAHGHEHETVSGGGAQDVVKAAHGRPFPAGWGYAAG